jgi:hypothetical protein
VLQAKSQKLRFTLAFACAPLAGLGVLFLFALFYYSKMKGRPVDEAASWALDPTIVAGLLTYLMNFALVVPTFCILRASLKSVGPALCTVGGVTFGAMLPAILFAGYEADPFAFFDTMESRARVAENIWLSTIAVGAISGAVAGLAFWRLAFAGPTTRRRSMIADAFD